MPHPEDFDAVDVPDLAAAADESVRATLGSTRRLRHFLADIDELTLDERRTIVDQAIVLLDSFYAHLPLKRAMHAIDPVQRLRLLRHRLPRLPTEFAFHREMIATFTSLRDLHTNYVLPRHFAEFGAILPFHVERCFEAGSPIYIVTRLASGVSHPHFTRGVEVTHWNGVPIGRAVEIAASYHAGSNDAARHARGVDGLTARAMITSLPPDEEWVVVGYRGADGRAREVRFDWIISGYPERPGGIAADPSRPAAAATGLDIEGDAVQGLRKLLFAQGAVAARRRMDEARDEAVASAETSGAAPTGLLRAAAAEGGARQRVQALESTFPDLLVAKVFEAEGQRFGHIRIHNFEVHDDRPFVAEVARLLQHPQMPKDGLVIDVRGNPGGLIWAGERMLQLLTPKRIEPCRLQFISTAYCLALCGAAPTLKQWLPSLERAVETGATFSAAFPLTPPERCNDIGQQYSGPVVLITDGRSYSTTDFLAAGFRDHGIGKILGVDGNTGAGGANVWDLRLIRHAFERAGYEPSLQPLPRGADMRVSIRRALRVGPEAGTELEDLGVEPDERHEMTREDLLNGNVDLLRHAARIIRGIPRDEAASAQPAAGRRPRRKRPAVMELPADDDQTFLDALRDFEAQHGQHEVQPNGCEDCGGGPEGSADHAGDAAPAGATSAQRGNTPEGENLMSGSSDREFMDALRAFEAQHGGGDDGGGGGDDEFARAIGAGGGGGQDDFDQDDFDDGGGDDQDREFMQALARFGGGGAGAMAGGSAAEASGNAAAAVRQVCSTYRSVRPVINGMLGFISALPGVGTAAAAAVRSLMTVLDAICRGSGNIRQLCQRWRQVRPIITRLNSVIRRIPFIGSRTARPIQTLISAVDAACRNA